MTDFTIHDILYEDNHLMVVNKHAGDLVQADSAGETGLEDAIKSYIRRRDSKPGDVFLGVVHRIDRPVSGAVVFAKTSKALVRLNEMIRRGEIDKRYWVVTEELLPSEQGTLTHHIVRDGKTNRSRAHVSPTKDSKEARLEYRMVAGSTNYYLYEVRLLTGRHHQIRAQFSKEGAPIRGDLKYGAKRSIPSDGGGGHGGSSKGGGISLHSRRVSFVHPVKKTQLEVVAPVPKGDNLWKFFEQAAAGATAI
ncbi:MAG: RluA family pseudouridine synthase [Alistipes sp.]|jgi:23S rRNA pseudouridine1911/1915/1917 synthase|nr:RluA family pseudouridine synthase [Alistipes sp.]